jgi:hypothetical protein
MVMDHAYACFYFGNEFFHVNFGNGLNLIVYLTSFSIVNFFIFILVQLDCILYRCQNTLEI